MLTISRKKLNDLTENVLITASVGLCDELGLRVMVSPDREMTAKLVLAVLGILGPDQVRLEDTIPLRSELGYQTAPIGSTAAFQKKDKDN